MSFFLRSGGPWASGRRRGSRLRRFCTPRLSPRRGEERIDLLAFSPDAESAHDEQEEEEELGIRKVRGIVTESEIRNLPFSKLVED